MTIFANFSIMNYAVHLLAGALLMVVFFIIYTRVTVYDEMALIMQGNSAAALSLGGTLLGFMLTIASAILHSANLVEFLIWAAVAMLVQILAYMIAAKLLHMSQHQLESGNTAFGGLLGAISIAAGILNAACLS